MKEASNSHSQATSRAPRTWVFWTATWSYLAFMVAGAHKLGFFDPNGTPITPNEWGDVLAGLFSPLAFLWLIYASLSQKAELELQRQELAENNKTQRDQQKAMDKQALALGAQIKRLEAESDAKYEPILILVESRIGGPDAKHSSLILENVGGAALNVHFSEGLEPQNIHDPLNNHLYRLVRGDVASHWMTGERMLIEIPAQLDSNEPFRFTISMRRLDSITTHHNYQTFDNFSRIILIERIHERVEIENEEKGY